MVNSFDSNLFESVQDRANGMIRNHMKSIMSRHQALIPSARDFVSRDGRFLWFSAVMAPNGFLPGGRRLAVVWDKINNTLSIHRDMQLDGGFLVDPDGGAYWSTANQILYKQPQQTCRVERVLEAPDDMRVFPGRMASVLSYSSDMKSAILDISEADTTTICSLELSSGTLTRWAKLTGGWHSPMSNPRNPEQMLILRSSWKEYANGIEHEIDKDEEDRAMCLWTLNQGGAIKYVPTGSEPVLSAAWSRNGKTIYFCGCTGIYNFNMANNTLTCLSSASATSFDVSGDDNYICYDQPAGDNYPGCAYKWIFLNLHTKKSVTFCDAALLYPSYPSDLTFNPAPKFAFDDNLVAANTVHNGKVTISFADTRRLIDITK